VQGELQKKTDDVASSVRRLLRHKLRHANVR